MLPLVIDDTAAIPERPAFGQHPGREALGPFAILPADDIAMAIAKNRDQRRVLDPLGHKKRAAGLGMGHHPALETHPGQVRDNLVIKIILQRLRPVRILAFGRDRNALCQNPAKGPGIEQIGGLRDGGGTGHALNSWISSSHAE